MRLLYFLFITSVFAKPLEIDIQAKSAILMNATNGAILYEKHAHLPSFPASTTKVATALYVLDKHDNLDKMVTVSADALKVRTPNNTEKPHPYWLDTDGTVMGLKKGENISVNSLLHGLMLVSGNDAANVLAENLAGSVPDFVSSLNEYLKDLGCKSTHFCNPHGLTHPEHMTTAYDLAIITKKALEFPYFRKIVSTLEFTKPKSNKQPPVDLKLTNPLLKPNSQYFYPKAIGVKTGYTSAAQNTLIAAAEHEGRLLIAVLLGYEKSSDRFLEARKLFETAFNEPTEKRRVLGPENIFTKEIQGSKKPLKASLMKSLVIEYFPSEESPCKAALHWSVSKLPIRKGQKVATVEIIDDRGQLLEKADLFALEEMKGSFLYTVYDKFCSLFGL